MAQATYPEASAGHTLTIQGSRAPLFGLASNGVYRAAVCCHPRGALLPHPFTLAGVSEMTRLGGLLSAALSVGSRPPGVTWRPALRSPDFPLLSQRLPGRLRVRT